MPVNYQTDLKYYITIDLRSQIEMTYCNKNDANCIDLNDENNKA